MNEKKRQKYERKSIIMFYLNDLVLRRTQILHNLTPIPVKPSTFGIKVRIIGFKIAHNKKKN